MSVEHRLDVFTSVGAPCVRCHMGMALVWDSHGDPENEDAWEGICLRCTREEMNQLRGIAFTILTEDGRDLAPYVTLPIRSKWFAAREGAMCVKCNERAYVSRLGVIGGLCLDLCRPCAVEGAQRFVDLLSAYMRGRASRRAIQIERQAKLREAVFGVAWVETP